MENVNIRCTKSFPPGDMSNVVLTLGMQNALFSCIKSKKKHLSFPRVISEKLRHDLMSQTNVMSNILFNIIKLTKQN